MRGTVIKRSTNSYSLKVSLGLDPTTKRYKQHWETVKGTKKDAEKRLAELLHQLDTGSYMKPGKTTLGEFLERWLADYVKPNLSPRTTEGYEHIIRQHIAPALGNTILTALKPEHLQRYYAEKQSTGRRDGKGGLSGKTVRHHHITLHGALQSAVKWGLIARNPADAVSPPRFQRKELHTMTESDIQSLLDAVRNTPYFAIYHLALYTGMRRSEILALKWTDIDLILCQLSVTRTLHHLRDETFVFRLPKTAKGRRNIALSPSTALVLREHRMKQEFEHKMLGISLRDDALLFSHVDGTPLLPDTITRYWIKTVRKLGLKGIHLHDCRHSHASLLLKQNVHPLVVSQRLGHANIQTTLDVYSHVMPGLQEAAALKFDELVTKQSVATD